MQQTDSTTTGFPPLYVNWLDEWLDGSLPVEEQATCSNCAMLPPVGGPVLGANHYFSPNAKCCTYIPTLPNFLVGRILADKRDDMVLGRESILARLQHIEIATPFWLEKSLTDDFRYRNRHPYFGQLGNMVCPHYLDEEGGLCSIWKHRNGVCSTWYCKHTRGEVGLQFWTSLRDLFTAIESELAKWCALELGIPPETLKAFGQKEVREHTIRQLEIEPDLPDNTNVTHKKIWGDWHGRETDFYIECARLVERLSWPEVLDICGPDVNALQRLVQQTYQEHQSDALPEHLRLGDFSVISMQPEYSLVMSYMVYDVLKLPRAVLDLLPYFDGRPTQEALTEFTLASGLKITPSLVRKLVDFKILLPD